MAFLSTHILMLPLLTPYHHFDKLTEKHGMSWSFGMNRMIYLKYWKSSNCFSSFFTFVIGRRGGTRDNNIKYSWWHNYVGVSEDWWHFNNSTYRLSKRKSIIKALMIINSRVKVLLRKRWLRNSIIDLYIFIAICFQS